VAGSKTSGPLGVIADLFRIRRKSEPNLLHTQEPKADEGELKLQQSSAEAPAALTSPSSEVRIQHIFLILVYV
jgi:hypothetical protein